MWMWVLALLRDHEIYHLHWDRFFSFCWNMVYILKHAYIIVIQVHTLSPLCSLAYPHDFKQMNPSLLLFEGMLYEKTTLRTLLSLVTEVLFIIGNRTQASRVRDCVHAEICSVLKLCFVLCHLTAFVHGQYTSPRKPLSTAKDSES